MLSERIFERHGRLRSLQALRFLAAALVVFAHGVDANQAVGIHPLAEGTALENIGAIGVDIFFVISGFIITHTAARAPSAAAFLKDRFFRVAPIYWLMSVPAAAMSLHNIGFDPVVLASTLFFWPAYGKFVEPYLAIGWTLAFEMLFYLAMGAVRLRLDARWLLAAYALAVAGGFLWATPAVEFLGNPIILEFLLGVGVAMYGRRDFEIVALFSGLACLAFTLLHGYGQISEAVFTQDASLSFRRVVLWGIPSALLVQGVVSLERLFAGRFWIAVAALGDASYALYLSHFYVMLALEKIARMAGIHFDFTLFALAAAVGAGWLTYRFVETPLRRMLRRRHILIMPQAA